MTDLKFSGPDESSNRKNRTRFRQTLWVKNDSFSGVQKARLFPNNVLDERWQGSGVDSRRCNSWFNDRRVEEPESIRFQGRPPRELLGKLTQTHPASLQALRYI